MVTSNLISLKALSPTWFERPTYRWWCVLFILLLIGITFRHTLSNEFVWDAKTVFVDETRTDTFKGALQFWTEPFIPLTSAETIKELGVSTIATYYRPLVGMLHYIERVFFGTNPLPYNLLNIIGHGLVGISAFYFLYQLTGSIFFSFLTTSLFVVNPTKTEVVCWTYSDAHILGALFILTASLSYLHEKRILSVFLFVLGLFTIESSIIYPAWILLYLIAFGGWKKQRELLYLACISIVTVVYFFIRTSALGLPPTNITGFLQQVQNSSTAFSLYLKIFIWPDAPVTVYHTADYVARSVSLPHGLLVIALTAAILAISYRYCRWQFFFFGAFLLWIFIFLFGGTEYFIAEKGLYFSGLFLTGGIIIFLMRFVPSRILLVGVVVTTLLHASETTARSRYWLNSERYLTQLLAFDRDFLIANLALGSEYLDSQRFEEAEKFFSDLTTRYPQRKEYKAVLSETYFRQALAAIDRQDFDTALVSLEKAVKITPNRAKLYNNIGNIHLLKKNFPSAIFFYERSLEHDQNSLEAYYNLAIAYKESGDLSKFRFYQAEYNRRARN